jgi:hypothetical protein
MKPNNSTHYPDAYCVKCREHTPTSKKHTIVLSSSARAMTGECPKCGSTVYKILPGKAEAPKAPKGKSNIVSINHRSWMQTAMSRHLAEKKAQSFHQPSFVYGVSAGVLIMLAVIFTHVYLV